MLHLFHPSKFFLIVDDLLMHSVKVHRKKNTNKEKKSTRIHRYDQQVVYLSVITAGGFQEIIRFYLEKSESFFFFFWSIIIYLIRGEKDRKSWRSGNRCWATLGTFFFSREKTCHRGTIEKVRRWSSDSHQRLRNGKKCICCISEGPSHIQKRKKCLECLVALFNVCWSSYLHVISRKKKF